MIIDFFDYGSGGGGGSAGLKIVFLTASQTDAQGVPNITSPDSKSIYFAKPKPEKSDGHNIFNEWVYITPSGSTTGRWELFGPTTADMIDVVRTVNGKGPDEAGNVNVTVNQSFLPSFVTNKTTKEFCESVVNAPAATVGTSFTGPLTCTDLPSGLNNAEAVVSVIGTSLSSTGKVIHIYLYSTTTAPYAWEYNYYNGTTSGWVYYDGYTKLEVNDLLDEKSDKTDTYTKSETQTAITTYGNKKNPFNYIKQLDDYLFEVEFSTENIDQGYAYNLFSAPATAGNGGFELGGSCTGVYSKGKALRQYDWYYDNEAEFLVRRPADVVKNKYANFGIATAFPYFTKEVVEKGEYNEKYKLIAFSINDGLNEKGLFIQGNVTPKKTSPINVAHTGTPYKGSITTNMIGRIVLDNCATVQEAEEELRRYDIKRVTRLDEHYDQHWLIADSVGGHAVLEFTQNGTSFNFVKNGTTVNAELLSNFNVSASGAITANTFELNWNAINSDSINNAGLERWELAAVEVGKQNPDLQSLRSKLMYTNFYKYIQTESTDTPIWFSEFCGETDTVSHTILTPATAYQAKLNPMQAKTVYAGSLAKAVSDYTNRSRTDGKTWQTVHSIIYDFENKSMNIAIQERLDKAKTYYLFDNKADKSTTLAGYGITDAKIESNKITLGSNSIKPVKSVNNTTPDDDGNVNVATFSNVPSSMNPYKTGYTTAQFCQQFLSTVNPPTGSAYLTGGICFTDMPQSFFVNSQGQSGYANCELMIYVPSTGCLLLEIDTTNNFTQKWKGLPGKFRAIYDVSKKSLIMPWAGLLTCPQSAELIGTEKNAEFKFIPESDSDAVSKYWFDKNAVKTVNNVTPTNGNVDVKTFTKITASGIVRNGTTAEYCQSICNNVHPKAGQAFLDNSCSFTDMPFSGNAEILITVPVDDLLVLELSSADSFASGDDIAGKWIAMWWGRLVMSWQGYMTCPKNSEGNYVPINNSDGVSKYYLDNQMSNKVDTSRKIADIDLNNDISASDLMEELLNVNITVGSRTKTLQNWIQTIADITTDTED